MIVIRLAWIQVSDVNTCLINQHSNRVSNDQCPVEVTVCNIRLLSWLLWPGWVAKSDRLRVVTLQVPSHCNLLRSEPIVIMNAFTGTMTMLQCLHLKGKELFLQSRRSLLQGRISFGLLLESNFQCSCLRSFPLSTPCRCSSVLCSIFVDVVVGSRRGFLLAQILPWPASRTSFCDLLSSSRGGIDIGVVFAQKPSLTCDLIFPWSKRSRDWL